MSPGLTLEDSGAAASTARPHRLRHTLGAGPDLRRRLLVHHVPLALVSTVVLLALIALVPAHRGRGLTLQRLASPTGDVALLLLALTLLVGPANLLLRRRNPVNSYLRRDVGTWTAIWSVIHVVAGLQGHSGSTFGFVDYFFVDGRPLVDDFGMGNWTGLAATVLVLLLLVLSTDRMLGALKAGRWKQLQRLNYTLFALVVVHALFYGALRKTTSPFTRILLATVVAVGAAQTFGILLWRRRARRGVDRGISTRSPGPPRS